MLLIIWQRNSCHRCTTSLLF